MREFCHESLASLDTPGFQRQSRELAKALRKAATPVTFVRAEGYNHYELPETFTNPYGIPCRQLARTCSSRPLKLRIPPH